MAMQGQWGPPPGPPPGGGYEFTQDENRVIGSAGLWARVLAIISFVNAALGLLNCNPFTVIMNAIYGAFFLMGGNALAAVVNTQGNDIGNMMQAMSKLGTVFKIRVWTTIVVAALMLLFALVVFVLALRTASVSGPGTPT